MHDTEKNDKHKELHITRVGRYTFDNTVLLFLCSGKSELTYRQKKHLNSTLY